MLVIHFEFKDENNNPLTRIMGKWFIYYILTFNYHFKIQGYFTFSNKLSFAVPLITGYLIFSVIFCLGIYFWIRFNFWKKAT